MLTDDDRRAHYKPLSHDALVAIVVELLDERDRGVARVGELEAQLTQSETAKLTEECSLCHVPLSTGSCKHLLDLGDGRVALSRSVWESLIEDHHALAALSPKEDVPDAPS